jgi:hypothetical protein
MVYNISVLSPSVVLPGRGVYLDCSLLQLDSVEPDNIVENIKIIKKIGLLKILYASISF